VTATRRRRFPAIINPARGNPPAMITHEGLPILTSGTAAASFGLASVHRAGSNRTP